MGEAALDRLAQSWFERRTFRAQDFTIEALAAAKGPARVSVVIPARDEAETIGPIIAVIRDALMGRTALVDELLVIDSDSSDATAEVAAAAGATVYAASAIAPEHGWRPGKGEAMWKSLFVAGGDIIVFVDGDLTSFSAAFVTGLLGPLLEVPEIEFVKGFYDRDLGDDPAGEAEGGRVTELMARPVIGLWWPELSGVIQPLAGEWAARRTLLASLPFPCGYGVECAALLDTYRLRGLDAIAQVDLDRRAHTHQDLASLGVMAAEVLAAAERRRFPDSHPRSTELAQPVDAGGSRHWNARPVNAQERPPHGSLPESQAAAT